MDNTSKKIFTNTAISLSTFFGGPLAAGFLISLNYKTFGNENAARNSIFIGVISTILLFAVIFLIPENIINNIPKSLFPTIYTTVIAVLVKMLQGKNINEFLANNGQKASIWLAMGYGFLGFIIISGFLVIVNVYLNPNLNVKSIKIEKNITLYYNKDVDESKSELIANTIKISGFFDENFSADLFVSNEDKYYRLKFVIFDTTLVSDSSIIVDFNRLEKFLNYNINIDKKIEIGFTDINLSKNFELAEKDISDYKIYEPLLYLKSYPINDFHTIYYNASVPLEDVKKVEDSVKRLKVYFPANRRIDIVFLDNGNGYTVKLFIIKRFWNDPETKKKLKNTIDYFRSNGIEKNIKLVMVDNQTFEEQQI